MMKALKIFSAIALSAGLIASASAATSPINANKITKRANVSYTCQGGKHLTVSYGFNAAGVPVTATARVNGQNRVMRYDLNHSDNVSSFFKDARGYRLGASNIDSRNYRKASVMVTEPNNRIAFKSCMPRTR
ncbi:adhesin [Conchiformibius steedae DSM 2580]|uniref:Adhesin n=1 Tax=Conchiformibius steedae DSM 2580 TaxID=1121352 RepID=A0AAE9HV69_9NEIS|nr:hypothetical protein [Conchiformibius steedae]QMT33565.1 adhesin [Conchiformibius steedae]URD68224.1 adhesin [Conchiformibius steedae DSM 2580]